jgi:exopolyphosphatase/guanosine-5'-triphosphate,3'-diphosphate pyrophosphatase
MRIAAIDIGTNTALLLIADIDEQGSITPIVDQLQVPRLGEESHLSGIISASAIERTIAVLRKYKDLALAHSVDSIILTGTSALRDAKNRQNVLDMIRTGIGYDVTILNGNEEASLSFRGALSSFPSLNDRAVVIDIGGGSTEIAYYINNYLKTLSFPMGAVRLTERFFRDDPPQQLQISEAVQHIGKEFERKELMDLSGKILIGVAGTAATLACFDQHLLDFDRSVINGYRLTQERVEHWKTKLSSLSSSQIRSLSRVAEGREDIITIGTLILYEFMRIGNFSEMIVSDRGLRYGLLLREWEHRIKK